MSAPWGIEFNENVLRLVKSDFIEVRCDEDLDGGLVPIFGEVLAQKMLLKLAFKEIVDSMLKEEPSKRLKICELERMPWLQGETYSKAELETKLQGFFQH